MNRGLLQRFSWPPSLLTVWLVLPITALLVRLGLRPISPHDYWWPIVQGRDIVTRGALPVANGYLYTMPADAPFHNQPWLAQVAMYLVQEAAGPTAQIALHALLLSLGVGAMMHVALKRGAGARQVALLTAGAAVFASLNLSVRTQMYAYLPFLGVLLTTSMIARGELSRRWFGLTAALAMVWANVHGSFILAPVIVGMTGLGDAVEVWRAEGSWDLKRFAGWTAAGFAVLGATMLNPSGPYIYVYVFTLVGEVGADVSEWQAMPTDTLAGGLFYAAAVGALMVAAWRRARVRWDEVLVLGTLTALAINSQRNLLWWAFGLMLFLPGWLTTGEDEEEEIGTGLGVAHAAMIAALLGAGLVCMPGAPLFEVYDAGMDPRDLQVAHHPEARALSMEHPLRLVERLRDERPPGRVFHAQSVGGLLEFELTKAPEQVVFVDQRFEMTPPEVWRAYFVLMGARPGWRALMTKHDVTSVLLERKEGAKLLRELARDPAWRQVGMDPNFVLLFKTP